MITEGKLRLAGDHRTPQGREGFREEATSYEECRAEANGGRAEARLESVAHQQNSDIELLCYSVFSPNKQKNVKDEH